MNIQQLSGDDLWTVWDIVNDGK